jgi:methylated-DNA-[protein]-cysteine S-methyltransferase
MTLKGTKFQIKVWEFLKTIPKGTVTTYSKVAKAIGYPKAVRAVANAVGNNPNPIIVPCHRVIRANGTIGGYSGIGGIKKKKALLKKENIQLNQLLKYVK